MQVIKSFEAVLACLVDDFLCNGSEQLLIVFDQSLSSFILLDFEAVHIDKTSKVGVEVEIVILLIVEMYASHVIGF